MGDFLTWSKPRLRVAVIGLGVNGLATSLALAQSGATVIGYERAEIGNSEASSAGPAKILRYGHEDSFYTGLMVDAYRQWESLAKATGIALINQTGAAYIGKKDNEAIQRYRESLIIAARSFTEIESGDVAHWDIARVLRADEMGIVEPSAGIITPSQAIRAMVIENQRAGAVLHSHTAVHSISARQRGGVFVETGESTELFDRAVIAVGPRLSHLLPNLAATVQTTRQYQITVGSKKPARIRRPWVWIDLDERFYGFLNVQPNTHVVASHLKTEAINSAERVDTLFRDKAVSANVEYLTDRFAAPSRDLTVKAVRVCHYTNTPNGDFLIDECPNFPELIVVSSCSGHGFKFAPTTGQLAASLVTQGVRPSQSRFRFPATVE